MTRSSIAAAARPRNWPDDAEGESHHCGRIVGLLDHMAPERFGDQPLAGLSDAHASAWVSTSAWWGSAIPDGRVWSRRWCADLDTRPLRLRGKLPGTAGCCAVSQLGEGPAAPCLTVGALAAALNIAMAAGR
jgi:hypothetical protein